MDRTITFVDHQQETTILGVLRSINAMHPHAVDLLQFALDRGGYVAGGFATIIAREFVLNKWTGTTSDRTSLLTAIRRHIGNPCVPTINSMMKNVGNGDIDVWFPDQAALTSFLTDNTHLVGVTDVRRTGTVTKTGTAIEYVIEEQDRIQVIKTYLMPKHEQLRRFDIFNAMCAFDDRCVTVPDGWEELERNRKLHVHVWKSPWTLSRFFKWYSRKEYRSITEETGTSIKDAALDALKWYRTLDAETIKSSAKNYEKARLVTKERLKQTVLMHGPAGLSRTMKKFIGSLSASDLVELSAYMMNSEDQSYNHALNELANRMFEPTSPT